MELVAFVASASIVLGAPAAAAVFWLRTFHRDADSIDAVAVAYGGVAISALSLWAISWTGWVSWAAVIVSAVAGAAVVAIPALVEVRRGKEGTMPIGPNPLGRNPHFGTLGTASLAFAVLVYVPFLSYGLQRADGVHRMAMTDWYKHLMTATALASADVFPPPNPFLQSVDAAPYYYGFHLVAASTARLAGVVPGPLAAGDLIYLSLLVLTLATALATPFVAYAVARTILGGKGPGGEEPGSGGPSGAGGSGAGGSGGGETVLSAPLVAACGATLLAGFDLIPMGFDALMNLARGEVAGGGVAGLRAAIPSTHLDYWVHHNERQFNAPLLTTAWAPQHMAGVLVALVIVHLLLCRQRSATGPEGSGVQARGESRAGEWLFPALLLAGLPALSAYVALGLVVGVAGAALLETARLKAPPWRTPAWEIWAASAAASALFAAPVLFVLGRGDGHGLVVHVSSAGGWVNGAFASALFGPGLLANLIDSAAVYTVEFGVLGVLAVLEARRLWRGDGLRGHRGHVLALVLSVVLLVTFVRPPVGGPNNLYARPMVLVWFLLAPFAAVYFVRSWGGRHVSATADRRGRWIAGAVVLCLLATAYAAVGVVLEGVMFWAAPAGVVEATRWLNANAPAASVVAVHPDDFHSSFGYWLRRPLFLADERHARLFGAAKGEYDESAEALRAAYAAGPGQAAAEFDALGVTHVILGPAASGRASWLDSPCFAITYREAGWIVAGRSGEACTQDP